MTFVTQWLEMARDDGNEDVRDLHPTLAYRLMLALEELWETYGHRCVTIESAARTEAEQRWLFEEWNAGRFITPIVADPDRELANTPIGMVYGSYHMIQSDGHAHAVDLTRPGQVVTWLQVHRVLDDYGLWHEVPGEPWHTQAMISSGWIPGPTPPESTIEEEEVLHIRHDTTNNWYWSIDPTAPEPLKEIWDPAALHLEDVPVQRSASMRYLMRHHWGVTEYTTKDENGKLVTHTI